jgi:hypothetical protein
MADEIRDVLRQWIGIDDEIRTLLAQAKTLRERKVQLGHFGKLIMLEIIVLLSVVGQFALIVYLTAERKPVAQLKADLIEKESLK